jgi:DNA-directed RNA polymerase specialized sigma24 family protein
LTDPDELDYMRDGACGGLELAALDWIFDPELQLLIERLPLAQRQVLLLRYAVGMPTDEIASVLDTRPDTVRRQHSRALAFLRVRLDALGRAPKYGRRSGMRTLARQAFVLRERRFALTR